MLRVISIGRVVGALCLGLWGAMAAAAGQAACQEDSAKFCKDVAPGGGRLIRCLKTHESELSAACRESMAAARARVQGAHETCADDVQKFCGGVHPGGGRVIACLKQNENELSPECREKLGAAGKRAP
jgi:hypothetical protein